LLRKWLARALKPRPDADRHVEAGNDCYRRGDFDAAEREYHRALEMDPGHTRANFNMGVLLQQLQRPQEAVRHYSAAIDADPACAKAWVNWGNVLKDQGDLDSAYKLYRRALEIDPLDAKAMVNCGTVLMGRGDLTAAGELYRKALELERDNPDALNNLATISQQKGDLDTAKTLYAEAAKTRGGFVDAQYNLGLAALFQGDFEAGWEAYELRFETQLPTVKLQPLPLPMAVAEDLREGRRVAIRKEQGIGDQLLFSTLLPELPACGADLVVETDSRLTEAFRRSLPHMKFVTPAELQSRCEEFDVQFPIGSLPRLLRRRKEDFLGQPAALLGADPERRARIAQQLGAGPKIGIAWRSFQAKNRRHIEQHKSAALEMFGAFAGAGARLVDLQYGDVELERRAFDAAYPGLRATVPGLDLFKDLEGVLAAIDCCELVVTTSNVTAHLAGVLGKRVWLVFPGAVPPFHYWVPRPDGRSLWYPSVEIVTDRRWVSWEPVFEHVARRWKSGT
jgi:tetratricopeptide (TPR) repeat protein